MPNNNIWKWFKGYRVHCETKELYDELMSWTGSKHGGIYIQGDRIVGYDVNITSKNHKRAETLLG